MPLEAGHFVATLWYSILEACRTGSLCSFGIDLRLWLKCRQGRPPPAPLPSSPLCPLVQTVPKFVRLCCTGDFGGYFGLLLGGSALSIFEIIDLIIYNAFVKATSRRVQPRPTVINVKSLELEKCWMEMRNFWLPEFVLWLVPFSAFALPSILSSVIYLEWLFGVIFVIFVTVICYCYGTKLQHTYI